MVIAMPGMLSGLFLLSASTMIYEIVLTRLLSVVTWYYLALAAVGMAMSGMTAGALLVQLMPAFFDRSVLALRLRQGAFAMAISIPLALVSVLAVPLGVSFSIETVFSFLLFTGFGGLPFLFSGIVVSLALTRSPLPIGKVYLADLLGAAAGCIGSVVVLEPLGAPGAVILCSSITFLAVAAFTRSSGEGALFRPNLLYALAFGVLAVLNAATPYGVAPIWSKGRIDTRAHLLAEIWNPISMVKASGPYHEFPYMFGPSPNMPSVEASYIRLSIDNFADTPLYQREPGSAQQFSFLNYDITSFAYLLRAGGSAAIIGIGGGRDALAAWLNGFSRIVGIEVNPAIVSLDLKRFAAWGGLDRVPGLTIQRAEGRSFLARSAEKFDVIQASMIDTEAATAAGAMTLTENSLYTVEAWRIFFRHLAPGGLLTFSRWAPANSAQIVETLRLCSLAMATLLDEGVADPAAHLALVRGGDIATLLVSNTPFDINQIARIRRLAQQRSFEMLYVPGQKPALPELEEVLHAKTGPDLAGLRYKNLLSFAPVYDPSPFFFNFVRPSDIPRALRFALDSGISGNVQAIAYLLLFTLASLALLAVSLALPLTRLAARPQHIDRTLGAAAIYFVAIGLGFMFAEAALMQRLTLLLGTPGYSLITVLAGLVFFAGLGSLASDHLSLTARGLPALASMVVLFFLSGILLPIAHRFAGDSFFLRVAIAVLIVIPPGFAMGGCFPVGLRWLRGVNRDEVLPWMWALNGVASVFATFAALLISMQASIAATVACAGACYLAAVCAIVMLPRPFAAGCAIA